MKLCLYEITEPFSASMYDDQLKKSCQHNFKSGDKVLLLKCISEEVLYCLFKIICLKDLHAIYITIAREDWREKTRVI